MLHALGIDMTDMVRGEGEWKNMQDVVRNSFRLSFEHLDKQQQNIHAQMTALATLRDHVSEKLAEPEVKAMMATLAPTDVSHARRDDFDSLAANVAELRADVARKATTKYVDDSLRRKLDRTDALLRSNPALNVGQEVSLTSCSFHSLSTATTSTII